MRPHDPPVRAARRRGVPRVGRATGAASGTWAGRSASTRDTYLLLAAPQDPCATAVAAALRRRGASVRVLPQPLTEPAFFSWQFDSHASAFGLRWPGQPWLDERTVAGVLVRTPGWIEPTGWSVDDAPYAQAELQAALLGWLWSLSCPVINRYPAWIWYRPRPPLIFWVGLLRQAGLRAAASLVTNVEGEGRRFADGGAAVYAPLTSEARFAPRSDEDWRGLDAVRERVPLHLTRPHEATWLASVAGNTVVWDSPPPAALHALEPGLMRLAALVGLQVLDVSAALEPEGPCVVAVDPFWRIERFPPRAQARIVKELVQLLLSGDRVRTVSGATEDRRPPPGGARADRSTVGRGPLVPRAGRGAAASGVRGAA